MVLLTNPNVFPWPLSSYEFHWSRDVLKKYTYAAVRYKTYRKVYRSPSFELVMISIARFSHYGAYRGVTIILEEYIIRIIVPREQPTIVFCLYNLVFLYGIEARSVATLRSAAMLLQYYWNVAMLLQYCWNNLRYGNLYNNITYTYNMELDNDFRDLFMRQNTVFFWYRLRSITLIWLQCEASLYSVQLFKL